MDTTMPANTLYRRNIYSEELLKTLYIDPGRALMTMTMRHVMTTMMMALMTMEFNHIIKPVVASYVPVFLILLQSYITTSLHQLFFKNLKNIFQLLCYFSSSIFQKFEIPSRYITTSLHCYINFPKICGLVL